MSFVFSRAALRVLVACASLTGSALLSGCDGVGPDAAPIALTATAADATTPVDVGQPASFTVTVTNPTSNKAAGVSVLVGGSVADLLKVDGIRCSAEGGTCPSTTNAWVPLFDMPAGSHFTFVVTMSAARPVVGDQSAIVDVSQVAHPGQLTATAHLTAVDGRSGTYRLFALSGLRTLVDVEFANATSTFTVASGGVDKTLATSADDTYGIFPSGGHLSSGPDVLVGQADFGSGVDTFIAARKFVTALSDLDGKSFSTFSVANGATASTRNAVSGTSGPLDLWQVSIAGSAMTVCADAIGVIATCDPTRLRHYTLTAASDGSGVFTAADAVDADTFTFQVARSGTSLIYLRADAAPADALFAMGFANAAPFLDEHDAYTTLKGKFGVLSVTSTGWEFLQQNPAGDFGPAPFVSLAVDGEGLPGLMTGTRAADGAQVLALRQGALTLTGTAAGEFGIAADRLP